MANHPELSAPDEAASQFLQHYAHPVLSGIVFAGLFAAIMSTADGFLNIGAAAVVHDIPTAIRGRSLKHELFWARIGTITIAIIAAMIALYSGESLVALLGAFGWGTFGRRTRPHCRDWPQLETRDCDSCQRSHCGQSAHLIRPAVRSEGRTRPLARIVARVAFDSLGIRYGNAGNAHIAHTVLRNLTGFEATED